MFLHVNMLKAYYFALHLGIGKSEGHQVPSKSHGQDAETRNLRSGAQFPQSKYRDNKSTPWLET